MLTIDEMNSWLRQACQEFGLRFECGGSGRTDATIAFVGEFPGEHEARSGLPFTGMSGRLLWEELKFHNIRRHSCYVTNVIKRRVAVVGEGKYEKKAISPKEIELFRKLLREELARLPNLQLVVCLGAVALEAIAGYNKISLYRGSLMDLLLPDIAVGSERALKVYALHNPAYVIRRPKEIITFRADCHRLGMIVAGKFKPFIINKRINPTFNEAMDWMRKMRLDKLPVALDIETSSGTTICVGLANDPHDGMCIPFRNDTDNYWTVEQECRILRELQTLVTCPDVNLVMQNGMFDASWLWFSERIQITRQWFDTMLAHHWLYPGLPHGLDFICTQYTTHPYYKDQGKVWKDGGSIDNEWEYNVIDTCITLEASRLMLKELEARKMKDAYFAHVLPQDRLLPRITAVGVRYDTDRIQELREEYKEKLSAEVERIRELVRQVAPDLADKFKPSSPKDREELLLKRLKLSSYIDGTGANARAVMARARSCPPIAKEIIAALDDFSSIFKFYSAYLNTKLDDDGRVRTVYNQTGTTKAPGRLSSSKTWWGTGNNWQNLTEVSEQLFIADEGYMFSYFDLSQAEARVVGWRYYIPSWIEQFERARLDGSYDAHRALAAMMFNVPYDEVPTKDRIDGKITIRFKAKRCRHGLNYRMMPLKLAETLDIPYEEALHLWELYHKTNPEIEKGWAWDVHNVRTYRKLVNAYGREWLLLEPFSDEATESIIAFYPQSTIGDKCRRIMYLCENDPEWPKTAIVIRNNHDSLTAAHRIEDLDIVQAIMKKHAEEPIKIACIDGQVRELIIPAEMKRSYPDEKGFHRWSTIK